MQLSVDYLKSILLPDFPSGSSINYHNAKLYLVGDDATTLLVMNADYQELETIPLFDFTETRIPKAVKWDFETSCVVKYKGQDCLLVLGSASRKNREKGMLLPIDDSRTTAQARFLELDLSDFVSRLKEKISAEINLEGSTVIGGNLILSNRSNLSNPDNTFIITSSDFWNNPGTAPLSLSQLTWPLQSPTGLGISELCYVPSTDLLLLTLSTEMTSNAYDDGAIGDSYIGWVKDISTKLKQPTIALEGILNLSAVNAVFKGEKMEGICVESATNDALLIHLVSDNDQGTSKLFKLRLLIS